MDNLKIDIEKVERELNSISNEIQVYPKYVDELEGAIQTLSSFWEGEAWSAFNTQTRADMEYLRSVKSFLDFYLNASKEAMDKYRTNEQKMIDEIEKLNF